MKKRKGLWITAAVLTVLALAVMIYAADYYRAEDAAIEAWRAAIPSWWHNPEI